MNSLKGARVVGLLLSFILVAACGLPSRNNPNDPQNAPIPRLQVVDLTANAGGGVAVDTAPRGDLLALSAAGSTRPGCDPATNPACRPYAPGLEFRFLALDSAGCPSAGEIAASASNAALAVLPGCFLHGAPGHSVRFALRVRDRRSGGTHEAITSFVPLNSAPSVRLDPPIILPRGGLPWHAAAPPATEHVVVRAFGSDPEGDSLHFRWRTRLHQAGALVVSTNYTDAPSLPFDMPMSGDARLVVSLTVFDGDPALGNLASQPAATSVSVGGQPVFAHDGEPGHFEALDTVAQDFVIPPGYSFSTASYIGSTPQDPVAKLGVLWFGAGAERFQAALYPTTTTDPVTLPAGGIDLGDGGQFVFADKARNRFWVESRFPLGSATTDHRVHLFEMLPGTATAHEAAPPLSLGMRIAFDTPIAAVDAGGRAWMADSVGGGLVAVSLGTAGLVSRTVIDDPGIFVGGIGARPDANGAPTNELWIVKTPSLTSPATSLVHPLLARIRLDGTEDDFEIASDFAMGLAWVTRDSLWVSVAGLGLTRVDASLLEAGATFDQAILETHPDVPVADSGLMVSDAEGGVAWAFGYQRTHVARMATDGSFLLLTGSNLQFPNFIDDAGFIGMSRATLFGRGITPAASGVSSQFSEFTLRRPSYDVTTGGLWILESLPNALVRFSADGQVRDRIAHVTRGGQPRQQFPFSEEARISPDGTTAWIVSLDANKTPTGIDRVDLTASPEPVDTQVLGAAVAADLTTNNLVLEPSAPIAGQTPFVWTLRPSTFEVLTIDAASGAFSPAKLLLPASERGTNAWGALSARQNTLCLLTKDVTGTIAHLRRISPSGTIEDFGTRTIDPNTSHLSVAAYSDATVDYCGMAIGSSTGPSTEVVIFSNAIGPLFDQTVAGNASALAINGAGQAWLSIDDPAGTIKRRITFTAAGAITQTKNYAPTYPAMYVEGPSNHY